jgi:hypothetical protein
MSILIKGMGMPTSCAFCELYEADWYWCRAAKREHYETIENRAHPEWCPLAPVSPHGRLIDADALMLEIQEYIEEYGWETDEHGWHNGHWCAMKEAAMVIDAAPTIIPASEEGE